MNHWNKRVNSFRRSLLKKRSNFEKTHQVLYTFIAGTGLIMFWYGIWEGLKHVPVLGHPLVAIALGGSISFLCGSYAYQLLGTKADEFERQLDMMSAEIADVSDDIAEVSEDLEDLDKVEDRVEEVARIVDRLEVKK